MPATTRRGVPTAETSIPPAAISSTPTDSNAILRTGNRCPESGMLRCSSAETPVRIQTESSIAATAYTQKASCQESRSTNRAPMSGPRKAEVPQTADTAAIALVIRCAGNRDPMPTKEMAISPPPPNPCNNRPATRIGIAFASAQTVLPTANSRAAMAMGARSR